MDFNLEIDTTTLADALSMQDILTVKPIFLEDWWLEKSTNVDDLTVIHAKVGNVSCNIYYELRKGFPYPIVKPAPLVKTCGPVFTCSGPANLEEFSAALKKALSMIPRSAIASLPLRPEAMLALGANVNANIEIRYTHFLMLNSQENVFDAYRENIRREIRKAMKAVQIEEATQPSELIELNSQTFARQGQRSPLGREVFTQIFTEAKQRGRGKILLARLPSGEAVAGAFIVWDKFKTYYLVGGAANEYRNSGAMSFVLHQAILDAHGRSILFDFEGSMVPNIARFFRAFSASPIHYPVIIQGNSIITAAKKVRSFLR
jgi:hypothetical protein